MSKNGSAMSRDKKKKRHITNFYLETLVLAAVFMVVILVLTRVFALSGRLSSRAEILTRAVHLAENAAEAVSASAAPGDLAELLEENGNAGQVWEGERCVLSLGYDRDMNPMSGGDFRVDITWQPGEDDSFAESRVSVYWMGETDPVYELETAVWCGPGND